MHAARLDCRRHKPLCTISACTHGLTREKVAVCVPAANITTCGQAWSEGETCGHIVHEMLREAAAQGEWERCAAA